MSEETTIVHIPHEETDEHHETPAATNEHDVAIAQAQADATVAQAAIIAESEARKTEAETAALEQASSHGYEARLAAIENELSMHREEIASWRASKEAEQQSSIMTIPTSSESTPPEKKEEAMEGERPKPKTSGHRPLFARPPKKKSSPLS